MPYNFDYSNRKPHRIYSLMRPVANILLKAKYKIIYIGRENLPKNGGYIIAANHITALDPVMISAGCDFPLHFMAKNEVFKNKIIGWAMTQMNAFPVDRTRFDEDAINYAINLVNDGSVLGIFPEGTRSPDFTPQKGKGGACYIAKMCKCDVVPVSIYTDDRARTGTKITIRFGKPIRHEELKFDPDSTRMKDLRHATNLIMERITELWRLGHGN